MTSCSASGPGRRWQKLSARTNSSSLIHLLRSTSWRCMRPIWPTGPPNASQPSLRKYQKISGIETCWDSEGCASARFGSPSSTPAHLAPTRVSVRSSAARRPRARSCGGIVRPVLRVITPDSMCSPVLRARPFAARWPGRAGGSPLPGPDHFPSVLRRRVKRIQVVEQGSAASKARLVIRVRSGDAGDELADPGRLLAAVFRVLHVDVVDDLGDLAQRWIRQPEPLDEHFERAELAFVRELRLEHVEAELALLGPVVLRRHELEARLPVDELQDEPGARHPVHLDPGARDPRASTVLRDVQRRLRLLGSLDGPHACLHSGQEALDDLAPGCSKEVDCRELGRALPQPRELSRKLGAAVLRDRAAFRESL